MSKFYHCSGGLTGGGAGALDAIASPSDKDTAFVHFNDDATYGNAILIYTFDVSSSVGESTPDIIAPDTGTIIKCLTFSDGITDNGNAYVYQETCRGQMID